MKIKYSPEITGILSLLDLKHQESVLIGRTLNTYSNAITNLIEKQFDIHEGQTWKNKNTGRKYVITGIMTAHLPERRGKTVTGPITQISYHQPGYVTITSQRIETFLDEFVKVA